MARMKINREIAEKAIQSLLKIASERGGKRINIEKYTLIPKAVVTNDGLLLEFTRSISKLVGYTDIESVIIDVIGLHTNRATQLEICRTGEVVYAPGRNRDKNKIKELIKLLVQDV